MKSKTQTAWQLAGYDKDTYLWTWKDGPYEPPFDFQIGSGDGQIIYSWDIIDTLDDKDSGVMTQTFGAAYTEDGGDATRSGMSTAEYIIIVIAVLIVIGVIGVGIYCMMRKRKMKNAVSFEQEIEDSKEKPMKHEDNDTPTDDNNKTETGGYDMSPISATDSVDVNGNDEEVSV
eukprot:CAMPEP_0201569418 /NCGR_PEP_ID=MMETSP0190_2-20130828/11081_1 /ASSEMBLY_ACC=CAM_ASM_000263 /TAXON_ID=37353 /ORGANISM="Rosalina sp." /LENGTH=173 /DNA_ID=CAMNT_0047991697 /DNA_START=384 /DNA_END=905 /DNA_ORIENTATION=-